MKRTIIISVLVGLFLAAPVLLVYSGIYNVAANHLELRAVDMERVRHAAQVSSHFVAHLPDFDRTPLHLDGGGIHVIGQAIVREGH